MNVLLVSNQIMLYLVCFMLLRIFLQIIYGYDVYWTVHHYDN